jgi:hypothetical protein
VPARAKKAQADRGPKEEHNNSSKRSEEGVHGSSLARRVKTAMTSEVIPSPRCPHCSGEEVEIRGGSSRSRKARAARAPQAPLGGHRERMSYASSGWAFFGGIPQSNTSTRPVSEISP